MKTKLVITSILLFTLISCKAEKEIEIIQANDVYFPINEVDQFPKLLEEPITQKAYLQFYDSIKSSFELMGEEEKEKFIVDYRLLVNEMGKVDKIQIIKSNYPEIDKLFSEVSKDFKFESATKDGQSVKSIFPLRFRKELFTSNVQMSDAPGKDTYFVKVEEMPEPIGGMKTIQEKILYPEIAKRAGIEGRVFVLAFIDETGNVADAKVIKGVGHGLDEAALEAVKQTKFTPGKQKGEPKKVQVTIPIMFKLESKITIEEILSKIKWNTNQAEIIRNASNYLKLIEHKEIKQKDGSSRVIQFSGGTLYGIKTNKWTFALENDSLDFISIEIKSESDSEKSKTYNKLKSEIEKISLNKIESHLNEWLLSFDKKSIARLQIYPGGGSSDIHILLSSSKFINEQSLK